MPFVLDASTVMSWAMEDETHPAGSEALLRLESDNGLVPALWWFEIRNALLMNERRGRIPVAASNGFLWKVSQLPILIDRSPDEDRLLGLARRHRLTAYDAAYLELAQREDVPLATLDGPLGRAARAEHVVLLGRR
ncbi:MAG TPA: type II toxin-antitoxin system VapC family toxin [Acetobacteraceae bacterium]|jgi:predicted nucleic acid-binding protein